MTPSAPLTGAQQLAHDLRANAALQDLQASPAWRTFVAEFNREQAELAGVVLSSATPPPQAELARQLHIGLTERFGPEAIMANALKRLGAVEAKHAKQVAAKRPPAE